MLLLETARTAGLDRALSAALVKWRKPLAVHHPGKVVLDLAVTLALGGDCLADLSVLRAEPGVCGPVASDPTVSRLIDTLAADAPRALAASTQDTADPGCRRDAGDRTLREGARPTDVQARLRLPSAVRLRRPRPAGHRRAAGHRAAAGQRRLQHRR